jgi:hypothetical protein
VYGVGDNVEVVATPAPGYVFVSWTEGDNPVSTSPTYVFTASVSRTLVANFGLATVDVTAPVAGNDTVHRLPNRALKVPVASLLANDTSPLDLALAVAAVDASSANGGQVVLLVVVTNPPQF